MPSLKLKLNAPLSETDPEMYEILKQEKQRQRKGLELIASENFTSKGCLDILGSCLTNKYSEGYPGNRYYGGTKYIDMVENLAISRSLECYGLDKDKWGVNVQCLSGSPANFAVFTALLGPHGRFMGLSVPDGGHLTHGFYTPQRKVSATALYFEPLPYGINPETGLIDYDELHKNAKVYRPKIIIAGISCYSRYLDYKRFKEICDDVGAILMADMSHISGLVAAKAVPTPFEYCDIVTTTTHKSLRGPRHGLIFFRKGLKGVDKKGNEIFYDYERKINEAVFPGLQGGPHNHSIGAVAVAMKEAMTEDFQNYGKQTVKNSICLCDALKDKGYKIVTDGTEVHVFCVDLRCVGLNGSKADYILEEVSIAVNKNTVPGDKTALNPSGIRMGTPALTSRGLVESDMLIVADFIDQAFKVAIEVNKSTANKTFKEFKEAMPQFQDRVDAIRENVEKYALQFPIPGHEEI